VKQRRETRNNEKKNDFIETEKEYNQKKPKRHEYITKEKRKQKNIYMSFFITYDKSYI